MNRPKRNHIGRTVLDADKYISDELRTAYNTLYGAPNSLSLRATKDTVQIDRFLRKEHLDLGGHTRHTSRINRE